MPLKSGRFYIHVVVSVTWVMQTQALLFEIKIRVRFGLFELLVWRHPSYFLSIKKPIEKKPVAGCSGERRQRGLSSIPHTVAQPLH